MGRSWRARLLLPGALGAAIAVAAGARAGDPPAGARRALEEGRELARHRAFAAARPLLLEAAAGSATADAANVALAEIAFAYGDDDGATAALKRVGRPTRRLAELESCLPGPFRERLGEDASPGEGRAGRFVLATDAGLGDDAVARARGFADLARRLEAIEAAYRDLLPAPRSSALEARAFVFASRADFLAFSTAIGRDESKRSGFYLPAVRLLAVGATPHAETVGALPLSSVMTLQHEAFHAYLHDLVDAPPPWLNEGVAELFGTSAPREDGTLDVGRFAKHIPGWKTRYERIVGALKPAAKAPAIPLRALVELRTKDFKEGETSIHYAEAWAFVHYLVRGRKDGVARLRRYVGSLRRGGRPGEAWRAAFGDVSFDALEAGWRSYVKEL